MNIVYSKYLITSNNYFKLFFITADFGFARFLNEGAMAATLCGSPMYMVKYNTPILPEEIII